MPEKNDAPKNDKELYHKTKRYEVAIKVISQKGTCVWGHKVGQEFIINEGTPKGMCLSAFGALFPNLRVLQFGGIYPWEPDPNVSQVACPDGKNPVIFELRRLSEYHRKLTCP